MTQLSTIASLINPLIGRSVVAIDKAGAENRYTIARLADKIGTLKDGSKGEYVVLSKDGETGVVINIHPNTAKKLASKGEGDQFKLMPVADHQVAVPAAVTVVAEPVNVPVEVQPANPIVDEPAAKEPRVTKKSQTVAIYKAMAGSPRKDIIAEMKSKLGLSDAGANTYYQNCKGGQWE